MLSKIILTFLCDRFLIFAYQTAKLTYQIAKLTFLCDSFLKTGLFRRFALYMHFSPRKLSISLVRWYVILFVYKMADCALTTKAKTYLTARLNESKRALIKKKRKRNILKGLYYSTTITSIALSAVMAVSIAGLPLIVATILPIFSAILTGLSVQFNFKDKQEKINKEVIKYNLIKSKLEYIINCNGNLTDEIWGGLLKELATY